MTAVKGRRVLVSILFEGEEIHNEVYEMRDDAIDTEIARRMHAALEVTVEPTRRKPTR